MGPIQVSKPNPGAIAIWDNLGAHRDARVLEAMRAARAEVRFLPTYSPDFNPIELAWAKIKRRLRDAKARTREALDEAMTRMTDADAAGWFKHCGIPYQTT